MVTGQEPSLGAGSVAAGSKINYSFLAELWLFNLNGLLAGPYNTCCLYGKLGLVDPQLYWR
jgi:hypothetical protein